jgi:AcrR family transcriptional regulator
VRCAAVILAERGVLGLNLADVVAAANVTKGALYFHFTSKDELIVGVEAEYEADSRRMIAAIGRDPDPLRRLVLVSFALLRRQLGTSLATAHNRLMLAGVVQQMHGQMPAPKLDWPQVFRGWFDEADQAGLLPPGLDLAALAETFDDCMIGAIASHHMERRSVEPLRRLALLWQRFLLPALVADTDHRRALERLVEDEQSRLPAPESFTEDEASTATPVTTVDAATSGGLAPSPA